MGINLEKGQKINLSKADGTTPLKKVMLGLGWDVASTGFFGGQIDLDASCLTFDENKNIIETIYFNNMSSNDGNIKLSKDNLTGQGDGDDETITVLLDRLPEKVQYLVFTITSYSGHEFNKVKNCFCRLVDLENNTEMFSYQLSEKGSHTATIMVKLYRHNGAWKANAIGSPYNAKTAKDLIEPIKAIL